MKIRCPQCKRLFDYDPDSGPARCTFRDCGWTFKPTGSEHHKQQDTFEQTQTVQPEVSIAEAARQVAEPSAGRAVARREFSQPVSTIRCPASEGTSLSSDRIRPANCDMAPTPFPTMSGSSK